MIGRRGVPARHRAGRRRTTATATSCTWRSTSRRCSRRGDAGRWRDADRPTSSAELEPAGAWPTWVLSNHDNPRHRTRYGGPRPGPGPPRCCCSTLRGTPFLYAGEELGLEDAVVPPERVVDPGGRDGCRAPIPWTAAADHGWGATDPWLPWPPDAGDRNVEALRADPASILHLYRRLLAARRASPALQLGDAATLLDAPDGVLAWRRATPRRRRPAASWRSTSRRRRSTVDLDRHGRGVERRRRRGRGRSPATLGPDQAVVLAA